MIQITLIVSLKESVQEKTSVVSSDYKMIITGKR